MKIGYQGIPGAYSEIAAKSFFKSGNMIGLKDFDSVFEKVESSELDYGIIPVENSLAGSIHKSFDLLNKYNLKIVGEVFEQINHQLLVLPGTKEEDVKEIYSHWQALAQCEYNIKNNFVNAKVIEYYDTAGSAQYIASEKNKEKACIASSIAAKHYKLKVLKKDFQDDKNNYTRFLIIAKKYAKFEKQKSKSFYKTSIIFAGGNVTGFLFKALACFSLREINLSKIESRPVPKSPWQYYFYLDFEGKYDDENIKNALLNLGEIASDVKILGSYQASKI